MPTDGVELCGYLDAAVGAGEAARRYLGALAAVGIPAKPRNVPLAGRDSANSPLGGFRRGRGTHPRFNLFCLNPEQLGPYLASRSAPEVRSRTNIGVWSWEVDVLPPGWREATHAVREIWTYSEFSAGLIAAATGAPVVAMHLPLALDDAPRLPAPDLPAGFRVLVMFDYLSTIQRKNPLAAIAAYRSAFAPRDGARLIVKSMNATHRPDQHDEVLRAAAGRDDITLIDGTVSGAERTGLIEAADCVLSLHRSEGFGLVLAEAIAAGRPVVATGYGGNVEFMPAASTDLVRFEITEVGPGCEYYPPAARWAQPDVEHAASLLRAVFEDRETASERARIARENVTRQLAPERIGSLMRERFCALGAPLIGHGR